MRRIVVVGTSGCGKTTFAQALAARLRIPHVELDALHWGPNWTLPPSDTFRAQVAAAAARPGWVLDGNYGKVRDIIWPRAEAVVWLDYALPVILARLARRTLLRIVTRERLWGTNRESARLAFFSRDSILLWAIQTYGVNRRRYPEALAGPAHAHLRVAHFRTPGAAAAWLRTVAPP
jgi:adenylate kinase family enzyme